MTTLFLHLSLTNMVISTADMFQNAANCFDMWFPLPQNSMHIAGQPYLDPIGSGLSSCYHGVYGITAMNNAYLNVMNGMNG